MTLKNQEDKKPEWEPWRRSMFIEVDRNSDKARIGCLGMFLLSCLSVAGLLIGLVLLVIVLVVLKDIFI